MWWRQITPIEWIVFAAVGVAIVGIILALLTPGGRNAFALLGLRIADALTAWLERQLSARALQSRRSDRG